MNRQTLTFFIIAFSLFISLPLNSFAEVKSAISVTKDKSSNLSSWKFVHEGLELQLVQRSPDQTRAFYQGRGFGKQMANQIATSCVFQTIVKNMGQDRTGKAFSVSLDTWRLKQLKDNKEGLTQGIKLKEQWLKQWSKNSTVSQSSRIAFKWSTFPSQQTFDLGGDYAWGMITFGLSPDESFDLQIEWQTSEQNHKRWIKNIQCPSDTSSDKS
jgi:hypothetical protein